MTPEFERRLGVFLWRSSHLERSAAGVFYRVAQGEVLDPRDRAIAREFAAEEVKHADLLKGLGKTLIGVRPDAHLIPIEIPNDLLVDLALIHQGERLLFAGFSKMIALGRQHGFDELVQTYTLIEVEERRHIAWGRRVLAELSRDPAVAASIRPWTRTRFISSRFRRVAQDDPWK